MTTFGEITALIAKKDRELKDCTDKRKRGRLIRQIRRLKDERNMIVLANAVKRSAG
jgi:hypothetical protein